MRVQVRSVKIGTLLVSTFTTSDVGSQILGGLGNALVYEPGKKPTTMDAAMQRPIPIQAVQSKPINTRGKRW